MKPLPEQDLIKAIAQARYGVNRSEALVVIFTEVLRARESEKQKVEVLTAVDMFFEDRLSPLCVTDVKEQLDGYYE